jgi:xylulokinase
LIEVAGQAPGVESAAAECLWLKQHEPYHFQRAASLLTAQDFIAYWLTGERSTEAGSASGTGLLDIRTRKWSAELLDFIDPALAGLLAPIGPSDQPRGLLRPALAREWGVSELVQIGAGSASPMLAALAAGCVANGTVAVELGSTGVIVGVGNSPVIDFRGEITPLCNATGSWLGLATATNSAVAPEVLRRHYGWSAQQFESMVASVSPGADGLLLLPYFTAESIPRLPDGTGVLHGINPENFTPAHMARAAAEGVALGRGEAEAEGEGVAEGLPRGERVAWPPRWQTCCRARCGRQRVSRRGCRCLAGLARGADSEGGGLGVAGAGADRGRVGSAGAGRGGGRR